MKTIIKFGMSDKIYIIKLIKYKNNSYLFYNNYINLLYYTYDYIIIFNDFKHINIDQNRFNQHKYISRLFIYYLFYLKMYNI